MRRYKQYTIDEFLGTTNYGGASFSPDNSKILVSCDASGIYNAYAIPTGGGEPQQLTHSTEHSIFAISYFPNDERFLYMSDQGGNELSHVYVQTPEGAVTDLTPGANFKAMYRGWAHDDRSFFIGTNERNQRFFDIYEYDAESYARELIYQNEEGYDFVSITSDRRYMALSKIETNADSDIYLYDREMGKMKHLTQHEDDVQNMPMRFTPDGQSLYYLTDRDSEYRYLVRYDLNDGAHEKVEETDWDILYAYPSKHAKYLVIGVNNDARTELRLYDTTTMKRVALPELPYAEISSVNISRDEERMSFYASSSQMPSDLFVSGFSGDKPVQLTHSLNQNLDPNDLVEGEVVRFNSYDGIKIPGILYRPHQAEDGTKVPALVWVHGGPGGQSRIGYNALLQFLINHGYAVYAINNRGSSGYGKTFFHMDDRKHGDADLGDVVECKKMLIETGNVDPERIGVIGGSYGGYMVLAALTFRPESFNAGVDIFGISNWHRTVQNTPPWWESFRKALEKEMGDFDDEEFFKAKSPLFHAENIVKPLMVLQGANDPRVLQVESDEIVEAVRANGVPVEYIVFEDEGHGFVKKENQAHGYQSILDFLEKYLKGSTQ
ncbi:S9 family peptidase [Chloroflexi bacterium TSY]|nr:S9 family peptidase [Chloroflexi bacterium TSY]